MGLEKTPPATPRSIGDGETLLKEATLLKLSRRALGLHGRFKRRHLVLTDVALRWMTAAKGVGMGSAANLAPRGGSALRHITVVRLCDRRGSTGAVSSLGENNNINSSAAASPGGAAACGDRFTFEVLTCDNISRVWAADSPEAAAAWVEAIRSAARSIPQWPPGYRDGSGSGSGPPGTTLGSAASTSSSLSRSLSRSPSVSPPQSASPPMRRTVLGRGRPPRAPGARGAGGHRGSLNTLDDSVYSSGKTPKNGAATAGTAQNNGYSNGSSSVSPPPPLPAVVAVVVAGPLPAAAAAAAAGAGRAERVVARGAEVLAAVQLPKMAPGEGILLRLSDGSEAEIPAGRLPRPGSDGSVAAAVSTVTKAVLGAVSGAVSPASTRVEARFVWVADAGAGSGGSDRGKGAGGGGSSSAGNDGKLKSKAPPAAAPLGRTLLAVAVCTAAAAAAAAWALAALEAAGPRCWDEAEEEDSLAYLEVEDGGGKAAVRIPALRAAACLLVAMVACGSWRLARRRGGSRSASRSAPAPAASAAVTGSWKLTVSERAVASPRRAVAGGITAAGSPSGTVPEDSVSGTIPEDSEVTAAVVPRRFLEGCPGDPEEARRRYEATLAWRAAENIDTILQEPQPHFDIIKQHYPHFFCGKARSGNHVYYERPGQVDMESLRTAGVTIDIMLRYYLFLTEWCWQVLDPRDDVGKLVSVFDASGISVRDAWGDCLEFTKRASAVHGAHYIERCQLLLVINVPLWFSAVWKVLKPMVNERTLAKIKILRGGEIITEMRKHLDDSQIPVEYGGLLANGRFDSEEERALRAFVEKVNSTANT